MLLTRENIGNVAADIVKMLEQYRVVLLYGDLGSGKTTLTRHIVKEIGASDEVNVSSPTFAIANVYEINAELKVWHFDFYRVHAFEELRDTGFFEALSDPDHNIIIAEWPKFLDLIKLERYLELELGYVDEEDVRNLTINPVAKVGGL